MFNYPLVSKVKLYTPHFPLSCNSIFSTVNGLPNSNITGFIIDIKKDAS
nr:MAG TPA: hypothetical protein [Crassvirales sp.]